MNSHANSIVLDPGQADFVADPYPVLLALQERDPAHWSPKLKSWIITRFEDVRHTLGAHEMSVDRIGPFYERLPPEKKRSLQDIVRYLNLWLVFRDPPEHTRLRNLMARAFTMKAVESLGPNIDALVDDLLADVPDGEFDFVAKVAMPLPALVIMDLLGVPRDAMTQMKIWSDKMQLFIGSAQNAPDKYEQASQGAREMAGLFKELIEERRKTPREDLISSFLASANGEDGFSDDEIVAACMLVLFGGHETTTNLLTTGLLKFISTPSAAAKLREDPTLAPNAVEECLRLDGPSGSMARLVKTEHMLHGATLKPGERVFAMINAANQDPRMFDDPQTFDITRSRNRHLTFGYGAHFCVGAALARMEAESVFKKIMARFETLELGAAPLEWHQTMIMRGLRKMPVRLN